MGRNLVATAAGDRRAARPPRRRRRTRRRCRSPAVLVGHDLDRDRRDVDGAEDAERADRQVERARPRRRRRGPRSAPSRAPCGRRRWRSCAARPRRAASPQRTLTCTPPSSTVAMAVAADGDVTVSGAGRSDAISTAASAQPAPRSATDVGGPAHVDLLDHEARARRPRWPRRHQRVRATRTTPVPSARTPAAIGGRFGPSAHDVLARRQDAHRPAMLVGEAPRHRRQLARHLAPEGAAVGQRASPARRPAGTTRHRARGRPARPTSSAACGPSRLAARRSASAAARSTAARARHRPAAAPRPTSRRRPTRRRPGARPRGRPAGAVSSAKPPPPSATCGPTTCVAAPSRRARSSAPVLSFGGGPIGP